MGASGTHSYNLEEGMVKKKLLLIGCACLALTSWAGAAYEVGDFVEDFTLNDHLGNPVNLSDFDDHVILLNWWTDT